MTLKETFRLLKTDFNKGMEYMQMRKSLMGRLFLCLTPVMVGVFLYRMSHYFYVKKIRPVAWLFYLAQTYITGMEIMPYSQIGESFYAGHANGTGIAAKLGNNATLTMQCAIGGGRGPGDVGGGDGLPIIGDNLVMGVGAKILGPITLGNNVTVGAASLVVHDVDDNQVVVGIPAKPIKVTNSDAFIRSRTPDKNGA